MTDDPENPTIKLLLTRFRSINILVNFNFWMSHDCFGMLIVVRNSGYREISQNSQMRICAVSIAVWMW